MIISEALAERVVEAAAAAAPLEACGLLAISDERIVAVYPTRNTASDANRFTVDPADHFAALTEAEREGLTINGLFHSHPRGPGHLSETDMAEPVDRSWVSLLVHAVADGWQLAAFRVADGVATDLRLYVEREGVSLR